MTEDMKRGKTEDRKGDREGNKTEDRGNDRTEDWTEDIHYYTTTPPYHI